MSLGSIFWIAIGSFMKGGDPEQFQISLYPWENQNLGPWLRRAAQQPFPQSGGGVGQKTGSEQDT